MQSSSCCDSSPTLLTIGFNMTQSSREITSSWTVNDVMRHFPQSLMVLNDFGVDMCCGAMATLDAAARDVGVSSSVLIAALAPSTVNDAPPPDGMPDVASASDLTTPWSETP